MTHTKTNLTQVVKVGTQNMTTANNAAESSARLPNYRIYDLTGGGVTHDIYAEDLEDAIQQGREWIEDGDWNSSDDGIYRTITLEACVREIVRYPSEAGEGQTIDADGDLLDAEGYIICTAADMGEIDEEATRWADEHSCDGEFSDELPECEAGADHPDADEQGHVWTAPHDLVGGIESNPGFWNCGGTITSSQSVCKCCGKYKTETDKGSQCHESEAKVVIEIADRDEASEAWLKEVHEEDGWLPEWLAEYLGCAPTVRFTEDEAKEWVDAHTDEDELDEEELEHVFAAIFERRPDDSDRAEGLWSHVCA